MVDWSGSELVLGSIVLKSIPALDTIDWSDALGRYGLESPIDLESEEGLVRFKFGDAQQVWLTLIEAPHPDLFRRPTGLLSPPIEALRECKCHAVVAARGINKDKVAHDIDACRWIAAFGDALGGVASILGFGIVMTVHSALAEAAKTAKDVPLIPGCVDVTMAQESDGVSLLTHNMKRYGQPEILISAQKVPLPEVYDVLWKVGTWMLEKKPDLKKCDTVGRTDDERIPLQWAPHPHDHEESLMRLDLP